MEDVLSLYEEEPDPERPVVCFDEQPYQMLSEVHPPLPPGPGQPARQDYQYKREGSCNLFIAFCPGTGWRDVKVTAQRTAVDFAQCMKDLVDLHFPQAQVVRLVLDNLNTHSPASLYQAFAPEEARRILRKLEFHFTPKHGSWLNMAEIELSVLTRQCLDRRLPDPESVAREVAAWAEVRNATAATVEWRFTPCSARTKLPHLYPAPLER